MPATDQAAQFEYRPLCKPGQLICGTGQTAVVAGWTVKAAIAKHLQPDEFAVIGQLYSPTRGISFLLRNLLANPHVRALVAVNASKEDQNAGGCECLLDFFENGFQAGQSDTGRRCWVIRSAIPGYIDPEIEASALEQLRQSIRCQEAKSIPEAVSQVQTYALAIRKRQPQAWGEPLNFPQAREGTLTVLPGPQYGHRIQGRTIAETWVKIIHRIKANGYIRPTLYDDQWQELIDLVAVVTDEPLGFYFPQPNYLPVDRPFIEQYISQMLDDAPCQEGIKYTYGQRLRSWFGSDQIEQVIEKLVAEKDSARAVMSLWDVQDHTDASPPCLNHIWVRIVQPTRGGCPELSLTATFRSNDMFSAWPANAIGLRALQQHIKEQIVSRANNELQMGPLVTISQSAHIYDDCWENADQLIRTQYAKICQRREYADPSGNFVVSVQDGKILVEHMTPGSGEVINCYSGSSASQLTRQISADCPALQVEHALYLGTELQKAEFALTHSLRENTSEQESELVYEQDKPLKLARGLSGSESGEVM